LQGTLEGIADRNLAPEELVGGNVVIELTADELAGERARVEGLLKSYGGIAIPTVESEVEIRLLVSVPAEHLGEFLAACRSGKDGRPAGDPSATAEVALRGLTHDRDRFRWNLSACFRARHDPRLRVGVWARYGRGGCEA
jgi:hypothetical protein